MSKYVLFTQPEHDSIRWAYTPYKIEMVLQLWNEGYSYKEIAIKASLKKIEVVLILGDLAERDILPQRTGGPYGNRGA